MKVTNMFVHISNYCIRLKLKFTRPLYIHVAEHGRMGTVLGQIAGLCNDSEVITVIRQYYAPHYVRSQLIL